MAKVARDSDRPGVTHLTKSVGVSLCGAFIKGDTESGTLVCPKCAAMALCAIETSTKAERKGWRSL